MDLEGTVCKYEQNLQNSQENNENSISIKKEKDLKYNREGKKFDGGPIKGKLLPPAKV